jgi:hypothetical protein
VRKMPVGVRWGYVGYQLRTTSCDGRLRPAESLARKCDRWITGCNGKTGLLRTVFFAGCSFEEPWSKRALLSAPVFITLVCIFVYICIQLDLPPRSFSLDSLM